ncbi:MAG: 4-hydroxy-tetrahydrodipicolinate reductase [Sphingomonas sp.]
MATRIGIIGAAGRMGRAVAEAIEKQGEATIGGTADEGDDPAHAARASDVLIDFSTPAALAANLDAARTAGIGIVIGTTGLGPEQDEAVAHAAGAIPVLRAANMSLGVNLLAYLVREAAARLGPGWDIEIVEMHHRHKVDAPSGTALLLGRAAADGRGIDLDTSSERGRDGVAGMRGEGAIGFASLRGGSVAGDHLVVLAGEGERIELGHRAESRAIFAAGAVKAALWLAGKPAGAYSIDDVLGL